MSSHMLFDTAIHFNHSEDRVCDIYKTYWEARRQTEKLFADYYASCGSIVQVLETFEDASISIFSEATLSPFFEKLTEYHIYDVSQSTLCEKCIDMTSAYNAYDAVANSYNRIVADQEDAKAYRADRKVNRGRFVGGGFGTDGAIKGMVTAGSWNLASGAAHSMVNAVGNIGSSIFASSEKKKLYNSASTKKSLLEGLLDSVFSFFDKYTNYLNDYMEEQKDRINSTGLKSSFDFNLTDDFFTMDICFFEFTYSSDRSNALLDNAQKLSDKQQELLCEAFRACPWNYNLLRFIFINYDTQRAAIWDISKKYGVNLSDSIEEVLSKQYPDEAQYHRGFGTGV